MKHFLKKYSNYLILGVSLLAASVFIEDIFNSNELALVIVATVALGLFSGRYLAGIWKNTEINNFLFAAVFLLLLGGFMALIPMVHTLLKKKEIGIMLMLLVLLFLESLLVGLLIKLIREKIKRQIILAETKAENSRSELQLLQSQLSPHFLFNTLNNLYGLSLHEHEKLPPLLLKLSELLRYSVYEAKELYVPVKEEIDYIKNYIDFEKLRIGDRLELKLELEEIEDSKVKIAPMLLIVFVENAFKHSKNTQDEQIFVEIGLKRWGNSLLFRVKNSFWKTEETENKIGGLGLENVKKRLELLYPNGHELQIDETENTFEVNLRLHVR